MHSDTAAYSVPIASDGLDFQALATAFASAGEPAAALGDHTGRIVAVIGLQRLPLRPRRLFTRLMSAAAAGLWKGKRLAADSGTNLWLSARRPAAFGAYSRRSTAAGHDHLDYDVAVNPRILRPITGDLRRLGPGTLLGRMQIRLRKRTVTLMYFTLER
ncbi:hypothetical protein [Mycolicibacterium alvei]|uniref:hypothetical protein n=1 Tax=Mycolicibacterium alvei TaxID=67081 RepID=UPI0013D72414|nr:hypothetical protein [Mycolicibacterium alvei]MCV7000097.1 hypothetical protein [Mycolicibacterium alvei]